MLDQVGGGGGGVGVVGCCGVGVRGFWGGGWFLGGGGGGVHFLCLRLYRR